MTGPVGEVLDKENGPIPGLYACGNDINSPWAVSISEPGSHWVGPALTFGYLTAMALAERDRPHSSVKSAPSTSSTQAVRLA